MNKAALAQLDGFTGTQEYHQSHSRMTLSDGAKFLAENADCFWLMDVINSYQSLCREDESLRGIQFWTLRKGAAPSMVGQRLLSGKKVPNAAAHVICERDTDNVAIVQEVEYTDFPFDALTECKVWVGPLSRDLMVAYLPSEY